MPAVEFSLLCSRKARQRLSDQPMAVPDVSRHGYVWWCVWMKLVKNHTRCNRLDPTSCAMAPSRPAVSRPRRTPAHGIQRGYHPWPPSHTRATPAPCRALPRVVHIRHATAGGVHSTSPHAPPGRRVPAAQRGSSAVMHGWSRGLPRAEAPAHAPCAVPCSAANCSVPHGLDASQVGGAQHLAVERTREEEDKQHGGPDDDLVWGGGRGYVMI